MHAHKTAISRSKASRPLRAALHINAVSGRVLDFGCGRGRDWKELRKLGYKVTGYDPHYAPKKPRGKFQTVLMTYVVNVLQIPQRDEALKLAWSYVKKGGRLIVTVRSEAEIEREAARSNWRPCREMGGGWITSTNTYQRGYTYGALQALLRRTLDGFKNMQTGPINAGGVMVILLKG